MKKIFWILVAALAMVACGSKETPTENTLAVNPATLSFSGNDETSKPFQVTASGSWTVTVSENWLHVNPASGNGNGTVSVSVDANDSDAQIFLTTVDGDIEHLNFLSSLKKLK